MADIKDAKKLLDDINAAVASYDPVLKEHARDILLKEAFGVNVKQPPAAKGATPNPSTQSDQGTEAAFHELVEKWTPDTQAEWVLLGAYYFQETLGNDSITAFQVNKELKQHGATITNITTSFEENISQRPALMRQIEKSGKSRQARKRFNQEHPELGLHNRNQKELARFLVYWAIEIHGAIAMFPAFLDDLFDALDLNPPTNSSDTLGKLWRRKELVKMDVGYRPSAQLKEAMKEELDNKPPLLKAEPHIASLLKRVTNPDTKNFLEEANLCLRANAPRAAMVMTWIVVVDHLFEYAMAHKLPDFNSELAKKNWKLKQIVTKDDFSAAVVVTVSNQ